MSPLRWGGCCTNRTALPFRFAALRAKHGSMTNTIALWLGIFIVGFFVLDYFVFQLDAVGVILRGILQLITKMAFWR